MRPTAYRLGILLTALALSAGVARAARPAAAVAPPKSTAVAVMVILDISGGMLRRFGDRVWMDYANEATVAVLKTLRPVDYIGVLAVDMKPYLIVPLQPPHPDIAAMIMRTTSSGGGLFIYSALERARVELAAVEARRKHVILFADAGDAEEMCKGIALVPESGCPRDTPTAHDAARALKDARVTLSVIALGALRDRDADVLRDLADGVGGRFAITDEPPALAGLFVEETRLVLAPPPVRPKPRAPKKPKPELHAD